VTRPRASGRHRSLKTGSPRHRNEGSPRRQRGNGSLILSVENVYKTYGAVKALDGASLRLAAGGITSLIGQNGSGKSTLVRVIAGDTTADAGEVHVAGQLASFHSLRDAMAAGIEVAFQELSLVPDLSVAHNLLLGREPMLGQHLFFVDRRRVRRDAELILEQLEVPASIDVGTPVRELELGEQQLVELARTLSRHPAIAIFDEPTAALADVAVRWLFERLKALAAQGSAVLFISHRLREVYEISDQIVVLRNGRDVLHAGKDEVGESELVQAMLGRRLQEQQAAALPPVSGEPLLQLDDVHLPRGRRPINITLRRGEILGIGGLQGQGQRELLRRLAGRDPLRGTLRLAGRKISVKSPRQAIEHGIGFIPEDRRTEGLLLGLSIRENIFVGAGNRGEITPAAGGTITPRRRLSRSEEAVGAFRIMRQFGLQAPSQEVAVETLSGGNQQKVLITRVLNKQPTVLLLADITRGVDVGTKAEIFAALRSLAEAGVGIVLHSTEASELVANCHRVAVMLDHTVEAVLEGDTLTEENIARTAVGLAVHASVGVEA